MSDRHSKQAKKMQIHTAVTKAKDSRRRGIFTVAKHSMQIVRQFVQSLIKSIDSDDDNADACN
jgi:hypothetical protein